jgi:ketosteroid isomerase-like protein
VERCFNAGDVDGLVDLYEPEAVMLAPDGSASAGIDAIRERWVAKLGLGGSMRLQTRFAVEVGDVALLRVDWTFTCEGRVTRASASEVARRQPDGSWRYVIDHPYGASL